MHRPETMVVVLPSVIPRLTNAPVVLRPFEPRDAALIASVATDPLIPLIITVPSSGTDEDAMAYLERQHERLADCAGYSFAIADADSDEAVTAVGQLSNWAARTTRRWAGRDSFLNQDPGLL